MKSEYAIILSVILGGLLGFGFSYMILSNQVSVLANKTANQISTLETALDNIDEKLANIEDDMETINSSVLVNQKSILALNVSIETLQGLMSVYKKEIQTELSSLTNSIVNNVANLQRQIDALEKVEKEWKFMGTWESTDDFYTESFWVKDELRLQLYFDGNSQYSNVAIDIYRSNGKYVDGIRVSGWWMSFYTDIPLDSGNYYLDVHIYDANEYWVNAWTYK